MSLQEQLRGRQAVPVAEAARLLGIGEQTVRDAMKRGEVPNAGIGGAKRVPAWFLAQKLSPPAP